MAEVHPTACVDAGATLGREVRVGPYCVIGSDVKIGDGTVIESHVVIGGRTTLGAGNHVYPFASLGLPPQDMKYRGEPTQLEIGDNNIIREYVTMSPGTIQGQGITRVGGHCMLMAGSHVAHDCVVGDRVIFANNVAIAGHVHVGDGAVLGGMAGVHQFARVGRLALVGAGAMVSQDAPPFTLVQGDRARLVGLNFVGLERSGTDPDAIRGLKKAFRLLFRSGLSRASAVERVHAEVDASTELKELLDFVLTSTRGICRHG